MGAAAWSIHVLPQVFGSHWSWHLFLLAAWMLWALCCLPCVQDLCSCLWYIYVLAANPCLYKIWKAPVHFLCCFKEQIDKIYHRIPGCFGLEWSFLLTSFQPQGQRHLLALDSSRDGAGTSSSLGEWEAIPTEDFRGSFSCSRDVFPLAEPGSAFCRC